MSSGLGALAVEVPWAKVGSPGSLKHRAPKHRMLTHVVFKRRNHVGRGRGDGATGIKQELQGNSGAHKGEIGTCKGNRGTQLGGNRGK